MELILIDFEGHSKVELCLHEIGHHKVRIILSLFVFRTAKVRFILVFNIFEFQRKKSQKSIRNFNARHFCQITVMTLKIIKRFAGTIQIYFKNDTI